MHNFAFLQEQTKIELNKFVLNSTFSLLGFFFFQLIATQKNFTNKNTIKKHKQEMEGNNISLCHDYKTKQSCIYYDHEKKKKTAWSAYTFYLYESLTQPDNEQVLYSVLAE